MQLLVQHVAAAESVTGDLSLLVPLLTTVVVAAVGWLVVNYLSARREQANKRREITVSYLIDAYRALDDNTSRRITPGRARLLERAISDIQLFGTPRQVELAHTLVDTVTQTHGETAGDAMVALMVDLRASLRSELNLPATTVSRVQWRISLAFAQTDEVDPGRRRELVWETLLSAYRSLEGVSENFAGETSELNRALCDVALCGSPWQAAVAEQLRDQLTGGSAVDGPAVIELMSNLRASLRADLSLEPPRQHELSGEDPA